LNHFLFPPHESIYVIDYQLFASPGQAESAEIASEYVLLLTIGPTHDYPRD